MSIGKGIAVLGFCTLLGFVFYQTKDTDVLMWLWLLLLF